MEMHGSLWMDETLKPQIFIEKDSGVHERFLMPEEDTSEHLMEGDPQAQAIPMEMRIKWVKI
jgi:hypothetical protein